MNSINVILLTILILSSGIILFQDCKDREVSLWVLVLFGVNTLISVIYLRDLETLKYNGLSTMLYVGITWMLLKMYFYLKFKKNTPIINHQLGMADIIIILSIGITFNSIGMILFFCSGCLFSLLSFTGYTTFKKEKDTESIPLAGLLVLFYLISIVILNFIQFDFAIDCSFILTNE